MDNRAGEMEVFALAADLKSFSAAGRRLKMSPSAVSKLVSRVEERLGTRLLVRSTRTLELTPEGEMYLRRARRILKDIEETEELVAGGREEAQGLLRVNSSVGFGERCILPLLGEFADNHPKVRLDLTLTDGVIDLIGERTDIAIRVGPMRDSSLMARRLYSSRRVIVASPEYLKKRGTPRTPTDLEQHNCIGFNFKPSLDEWPFRDPATGTAYSRTVTGSIQVSSGSIKRQLCLLGVGIGRIGEFHVRPDIEAGRLVPILEDHNGGDIELVHAVYAGHEHLAARIRAFIDFLVQRIE
ncbi:LysR family transcriptional regulator [Rhizobium sp. Leaf262]|uniref:LysR family transcriptional regulator n=1 Tax=Rhizobium sp. Leaf262 TaxID=1736312 RepID=UPI000713D8E3|nr:LysR family transcriptional regulator [Rhizobium sp. Leaf262]KQO79716.1 LysR family transcriptional regulator [Rhizobium sp. Leaf262]